MDILSYTHRVAVNAFLLNKNTFLLLKRAQEPLIWGPPGGKMMVDEDPVLGLKREVHEETGLDIMVFQPVTTWFGHFNDFALLSIDYLCTCTSKSITLSDEHIDFRWLSIENLRNHQELYFSSVLGFKLSDYELAWKTYLMNKKAGSLATTQ
jgi:8-oxo-dGTP diphosphatase